MNAFERKDYESIENEGIESYYLVGFIVFVIDGCGVVPINSANDYRDSYFCPQHDSGSDLLIVRTEGTDYRND